MAFTATNLYNIAGMPPGFGHYTYKSDTDTRQTVLASGYFNNTDDNQVLAADDIIFVIGDQGCYGLRVDTESAGTITTELGVGTGPFIIQQQVLDFKTTDSAWMFAPCDGLITRIWSINRVAPTDVNVIGLELSNTNVTDGGSADLITIAASSAAGTLDTGVCDGANVVAQNGLIELTCDGGGSTSGIVDVWIEIIPA